MKKTLDLSGLKWILLGYVIELAAFCFIGKAASQMTNGSSLTAVLVALISFAALLLIWFGAGKAADASVFYDRIRKPVLVRGAVALISAALLGVMANGGWTEERLTSMRKNALETALIVLILGIIWIIAVLRTTRTLMRACGHVAEQADDPHFSLNCLKTWRTWNIAFLLTILAMMLSAAIIVNVLKNTLRQGLEGQELYEAIMTNVASSILLSSIIAFVALIFLLIAHILFLLKIYGTLKAYHNEEVNVPTLEDMPAIDVEWESEEEEAEEEYEEGPAGEAEEESAEEPSEEPAEEAEEESAAESAEGSSEKSDDNSEEETDG